jgi:uncharacterized protein YfeS
MFSFSEPADAKFAVLLDALIYAVDFSLSSSSAVARVVDLAALRKAMKEAAERLPQTPGGVAHLLGKIRAEREARRSLGMTMETMPVDWSRFHGRARELLDDPFFWDLVNDDAPHGNDAGADLLSAFLRWRRRNSAQSPLQFLETVLQQWGVADRGTESGPIILIRAQAEIALAFAQIKAEGRCDRDVAAIALGAIDRRLGDVASDQARTERARRLRDKITSVSN